MMEWKKDGPCMIAAIGECMVEHRADGSSRYPQGFSGDTLNTVTYMARLLDRDSADLFYITAVGEDADSDAMLAAWESEGINTAFVRRIRGKLPGSYTISTGSDGERRFSYDRKDSAARDLFRDDYAVSLQTSLRGFQALYLSGISIAILAPEYRESLLDLLRLLRKTGVIIVYDPNYRAVLWPSPGEARDWADRIYREASVALPGFDDEKALFNDATPEHTCARLAALGVAEIVVKNGSSPCTAATGQDVASFPVTAREQVVDTTAAGDSFNAGYIAARLSGANIATSVRAGQSLANLIIQYPGAIIPAHRTPRISELIS